MVDPDPLAGKRSVEPDGVDPVDPDGVDPFELPLERPDRLVAVGPEDPFVDEVLPELVLVRAPPANALRSRRFMMFLLTVCSQSPPT